MPEGYAWRLKTDLYILHVHSCSDLLAWNDLLDNVGTGVWENLISMLLGLKWIWKSRVGLEVLMLKLHCTSLIQFQPTLAPRKSGLPQSQTKPINRAMRKQISWQMYTDIHTFWVKQTKNGVEKRCFFLLYQHVMMCVLSPRAVSPHRSVQREAALNSTCVSSGPSRNAGWQAGMSL